MNLTKLTPRDRARLARIREQEEEISRQSRSASSDMEASWRYHDAAQRLHLRHATRHRRAERMLLDAGAPYLRERRHHELCRYHEDRAEYHCSAFN